MIHEEQSKERRRQAMDLVSPTRNPRKNRSVVLISPPPTPRRSPVQVVNSEGANNNIDSGKEKYLSPMKTPIKRLKTVLRNSLFKSPPMKSGEDNDEHQQDEEGNEQGLEDRNMTLLLLCRELELMSD
jgi:hypothetical protein